MTTINLAEKFGLFSDYWHPRVIGEVNGQDIKIAKISDAFIWHSYENEDELFIVIKGKLMMDFRDKTEVVQPGEMLLVPKGIEHRPRTEEETWIMMIEPKTTVNTGAVDNELTRKELERI